VEGSEIVPEIEHPPRAPRSRELTEDHLYFTLRPCQWHAAKVNSREVVWATVDRPSPKN